MYSVSALRKEDDMGVFLSGFVLEKTMEWCCSAGALTASILWSSMMVCRTRRSADLCQGLLEGEFH